MSISSADHNPTLDGSDCRVVTVDQPFVIHLWEDRTRGEQWVPSYDAKGLALLSDEFLRIASNNAVENGQRIFNFKPYSPGLSADFRKAHGVEIYRGRSARIQNRSGPPSRI